MSTIIKSDITTMRKNLIREKEEQKKKREEEKAALHNTRTDSTLYNTKQWKKLRNYYIMNNPLCENCYKYGLVTPATQVHHKKIINSGQTLDEMKSIAYDIDVLQSLCRSCHDKMHKIARERELSYIDECLPDVLEEY